MDQIEVFFTNCNRAKFDIDKVGFRDGEIHFNFLDDDQKDGEPKTYAEILQNGYALVNWGAVSYVRKLSKGEEG